MLDVNHGDDDSVWCYNDITPRIKMKSGLKRYFQGLSNELFQSIIAPIL